ncbi:hypothetical protein PoB_005056600, partial [Plakobranchus ocellatus]
MMYSQFYFPVLLFAIFLARGAEGRACSVNSDCRVIRVGATGVCSGEVCMCQQYYIVTTAGCE